MEWRISPTPFPLPRSVLGQLERLGRVLLQFQRAVNQLYRKSVAGKLPDWVAGNLEQGKPQAVIDWQRDPAFKNALPRVIRPDILLTDQGLKISELDSVPGGIGLTAWLNKTYEELRAAGGGFGEVVGGRHGMTAGFAKMFPPDHPVHIVISKESETYVPEMEWLAGEIDPGRFQLRDTHFRDFQEGDSVYRFFELFDVPNVKSAFEIFERARQGSLFVTAPPKSFFEEKMLAALLWNRHLRDFWRQELGEGFFKTMLEVTPRSWMVDPAPMPPHAAIPGLELTDWHQLKSLSQKERELILKVSGFAETAWGARGVFLGSDLGAPEWAAAVDSALRSYPRNPYILQNYHKPVAVESTWYDFEQHQLQAMPGRVRLCPYYFVHGEGDQARAQLSGVLATICPADKKIIHGMREAILAPVCAAEPS